MSSRRASGAPAQPLRGFVEARGPEDITGWAAMGDGALTLVFKHAGKVLGECPASDFRDDLKAAGVADGHAGFAWRAPVTASGAPVDCTEIEVIDKASGLVLPDYDDLVAVPPRTRGAVEVRGPGVISGWATAWKAPLELVFLRRGEELGRCVADLVREEMRAMGVDGGRAGFVWGLPFLDPPVDPGEIEVRNAATQELVPDAHGVTPVTPPVLRGQVEQRGPDTISGWAWSAAGAPTLVLEADGEVLAELTVSDFRADLQALGIGDGRAAFHWTSHPGPPVDCGRVRVIDKASGAEVPDAPGLVVLPPPRIRGAVEVRGPEVFSGWATVWRAPMTLVLLQDGQEVARVTADRVREETRAVGVKGGKAGFSWAVPFLDPPIDPARIEVRDLATGDLVPDAHGVRSAPARVVRGQVEHRGPEIISGWAWGAAGAPVLEFRLDGVVLGELAVSGFRADLKAAGIGDGRAAFVWKAPVSDSGPPVDCTRVEVVARPTGEVLPDAADVVAIAPKRTRGAVEVRGPSVISGWATGWKEPLRLVFLRRGLELGRCVADLPREETRALGVADGRAGFAWTLPFLDPPVDPGEIEVRDEASGEIVLDVKGVRPVTPPVVRGQIEQRGPDLISGWAWGPSGAPTLVMDMDGRVVGEVTVSDFRADLQGAGIGGGRAAFTWRVPSNGPPLDCSAIRVVEREHGVALSDAPAVVAVPSPRIRGAVEVRGPDMISGWASAWGDPLTLVLLQDGKQIVSLVADRVRREARAMGVKGGKSGFQWRLPFLDPPIDAGRIEVRDAATGELILDAEGVQAVKSPIVRGQIEQHGPDVIAGWAWGPEGPVALQIRRGREVLFEVVAEEFRAGLRAQGIGDGRAAFRWELPFGDPSFDAGRMRVVDAKWGVEIPDSPDIRPVGRPAVCGVVESCSYRQVTGWAYDGRPGGRVVLEMVCDGKVVGDCVADESRRDLVAAGLDDGRHAFHWTPPRQLKAFDAAKLTVRVKGKRIVLPQVFRAAKPTGLEVSDLRVEASWLYGRLRLTGEAEAPPSIDVVADGLFLLNADIRSLVFGDDGTAFLVVELPRSLNDGRDHRLTLHDHREGDLIPGDNVVVRSAFNSMIEMVTPHEIRGWVIDPDDPDGEGRVDLYDGDRRVLRARFGRDRPEVAKAMGARHAWEFVIRRLPLSLFDGQSRELRLACGEHALAPHETPRLRVCWDESQSAPDQERFTGAVQEIDATGVKGYAIDHLRDTPVLLDILVDGEVVGQTLADRFVAGLKKDAGHGFFGFDWRFSSGLMNGRKRRVAVRVAARKLLLPPRTRSVSFPLTALEGPLVPALAPPRLADPGPVETEAAEAGPALLSLVVLSLNGAHVLEPFLRSVAATTFRDRIELIVIDHGSTDESRALIEAWRERLAITPLYRGVNHSFSASCNLGAALAKGQHLVMVNNDIEFTGDCLAGMRDLLDASPEVGLVGLRLLEPRYRGEGRWEREAHHTGVRFQALAAQTKSEPRMYHPVEVADGGDEGQVIEPAVTAALTMMRRADFRALGGFDEGYRYGYEDVDLALRMRARLGKLAVCRLGDSAIHNRSATRESKLVDAPAPAAQADNGLARANLDLFVRRFSRHLPRVILRQLVAGGEAWRAAPLRVALVVGDTEAGADTEAARRLGRAMRERYGWEPMLITEDGHDLALSDVVVSLRPGYELKRITEAAPGLITVAWMWNGPAAWEGRLDAYHLAWIFSSRPAAASSSAAAARRSLAGFLAGPRRRVAIKAQAENEPQARALAQAFTRRGQLVRIDGPRHWTCGLAAGDELVVAMAGVKAHAPFSGAVNVLCLTPGAEAPDAEAAAGFDQVIEPADPDAIAAAVLELHDRLRREFLGDLPD